MSPDVVASKLLDRPQLPFAPREARTNPVVNNYKTKDGRWLAAGIGMFWAIRTLLQMAYYSSSHWRGRPERTAIHIGLLLLYGGFAAVYFWSACRGAGGGP